MPKKKIVFQSLTQINFDKSKVVEKSQITIAAVGMSDLFLNKNKLCSINSTYNRQQSLKDIVHSGI